MIPLISFIEPANFYEGKFLNPMIQNAQNELSLHINIVVGDMGYISSEQKMELRKQSHTAVLTRVRENMYPPEENTLIIAAQNVQKASPYYGMATILKLKCTVISLLLIILPVPLAGYMETAIKNFMSALQLMNTTLELFLFIQRSPKGYCREYVLKLKEALKMIKTNFI